jgi:hypothetical protein
MWQKIMGIMVTVNYGENYGDSILNSENRSNTLLVSTKYLYGDMVQVNNRIKYAVTTIPHHNSPTIPVPLIHFLHTEMFFEC